MNIGFSLPHISPTLTEGQAIKTIPYRAVLARVRYGIVLVVRHAHRVGGSHTNLIKCLKFQESFYKKFFGGVRGGVLKNVSLCCYHRTDTLIGEYLDKHRVRNTSVKDKYFTDSAINSVSTTADFGNHSA